MPRSSSVSRSSQRTPPKSLPLPPPVVHTPSPLVVQHQPNGFMANVKEGFGLGVGVSVARNIVDGFFNRPAPTVSAATVAPTVAPILDLKDYNQCILEGGTQETCKDKIKQLK